MCLLQTPSTPSDTGMRTPRNIPPRNKEDAFVDEASGDFGYVFQDELCMDIPSEGKVKLSPERIKKLTPQEVQLIYQVPHGYLACTCITFGTIWDD